MEKADVVPHNQDEKRHKETNKEQKIPRFPNYISHVQLLYLTQKTKKN